MTSRVLAIGLDGADSELIADYCARGIMALLAGLREKGQRGALTKQTILSDDALWSSFATALPVGEHGRYHGPAQFFGGDYRTQSFADRRMQAETFWARLSREGRRVAVLDVPKCPLSEGLNGFQLCDWLVHGRDRPVPISSPASFAAQNMARFGAAPLSPCDGYAYGEGAPLHAGFSAEGLGAAIASLVTSLDAKLAASDHYLADGEWDLFLTVFKELHCAGHLLWDHVDPDHPDHNDRVRLGGAAPMEALYQRIDAAIGRLVEQAGADCTVVVFSPHGLTRNFSATGALSTIIQDLGLAWRSATGRLAVRAHWAAQRLSRQDRPAVLALQRRHRLFFPLPYYEGAVAIRFNLIGRDPHGLVQPGAPFDQLKARLTDQLLGLRLVDDGIPVVGEVVDFQALYPGSASDNLPDLLAVWEKGLRCGPIISSGGQRYEPPAVRLRPGGHDGEGWFVVAGPQAGAFPIAAGPIEDFAASIEKLAQ